ncbi:MAG: A/G-specific adenine glycosylase [Bacteriovoracia bacterium]
MSKLNDSIGALGAWFERQKRVLPWRDDPSLYRVWISEIMLQQTQVATVVPYFNRFMTRFPRLEDLAQAPVEDVLAQWSGLGYYSRARNIHKAAQRAHRDGFPQNLAGWLEMPGVGPYTAGAVLSIALDHVVPILDGNIERVMSRLRRVGRYEAKKSRLWRLSKIFVKRGADLGVRPRVLNQALMELGATVCTPKKPACMLCPLADICRARAAGDMEAYPPTKPKAPWVQVREDVHLILGAAGRGLLMRQGVGDWRQDLWDLPADSPSKQDFESLGFVEVRYVVTRHKVSRRATIWRAKTAKPVWRAAEAQWVSLPQLTTAWEEGKVPPLPVGSALKKTLLAVRARYPEAWREAAPRNSRPAKA